MTPDINYLAVFAAIVSNMVIGSLWYSPLILGKQWMKAMGKTSDEMKKQGGMAKAMLLMLLSAAIMAYVLAHIVSFAGARDWMAGAQGGFWVWLGFVATTTAGASIFEKRSWNLFLISGAYYLVALLVMGAILGAWR